MFIYLLFLGGVFLTLFVVNKTMLKNNKSVEESILDQPNASLGQNDYLLAKEKPKMLIRIGAMILGLDMAMIVAFVAFFDLEDSEPVWENYFAFVAMVILPVIAIFLITRGILRLRGLKKQHHSND